MLQGAHLDHCPGPDQGSRGLRSTRRQEAVGLNVYIPAMEARSALGLGEAGAGWRMGGKLAVALCVLMGAAIK